MKPCVHTSIHMTLTRSHTPKISAYLTQMGMHETQVSMIETRWSANVIHMYMTDQILNNEVEHTTHQNMGRDSPGLTLISLDYAQPGVAPASIGYRRVRESVMKYI